MAAWLLPENIADILPNEAAKFESVRRKLLDLFGSFGYELVIPPLLEYLDSLLMSSGDELRLRTFKLVDQLSGRTLGLRADITPQIARIDAHLLNRSGSTRLCYSGSVLHTLPQGVLSARERIQVGAELYGCEHWQADVEIIELMLAALSLAKQPIRLDVCHVGVLQALFAIDPHMQAHEPEILAALQSKDRATLASFASYLQASTVQALLDLTTLYGPLDTNSSLLEKARRCLPNHPLIESALSQIEALHVLCTQNALDVTLGVDLADLAGYEYHRGLMFAAYLPNCTNAVARGGRYDGVFSAFGRARAATGFSLDVLTIAQHHEFLPRTAILAPESQDPSLRVKINELRALGHVVIQAMPGAPVDAMFEMTHQLVNTGDSWSVEAVVVSDVKH